MSVHTAAPPPPNAKLPCASRIPVWGHMFKEKPPTPVSPRLGLWVRRTYLLNFPFSQVSISRGKKKAKALGRVGQYGRLSNAQRQAITGLTVLCCKT